MISFDEAVMLVREIAKPVGEERLPIAAAHRRILAHPVLARVNSPPSDVSAMDGYAVRDDDLSSLPARLRIAGKSFAGAGFSGSLPPDCAVRIFTGAPVPPGADRVVIQEVVRIEDDYAVIDVHPGPSTHIRSRGSDFEKGTRLLEPGTCLGYRQLVAAAGADLKELTAFRRPLIVILGTGDELVEPGTAAETPGSIPESVSFGVAALVEDWGGTTVERIRLPDDLNSMKRVAREVLQRADLVVVTGGASVGEKDFAKAMFEEESLELLFTKVAIKPGKPVWLGKARETPIMGLPGNPTSALVTARLLLAPLVAGLAGSDPSRGLHWRSATLRGSLAACGNRETFVRARDVVIGAEPLSNQDSSAQRMLVEASLLIRRRAGEPELNEGDTVEVIDF
ncbi:molybdopterin molybdotransferase MoeA [Sphingomonas sp. HDW15A]|uniref:molybdopterin molybdotransferase MoeA n=1 Tax=Sphingomonas sp. HDW15A TaxID=2714942 RepID=UPI00140AC2DC|nr:molybdopterin molybdotransferase MoeA [Sphingomonas sp. HDW15A]QIK95774.1 molybdopterin molybdotransferase MoeA [Sphingomonas sp. HDW15A]